MANKEELRKKKKKARRRKQAVFFGAAGIVCLVLIVVIARGILDLRVEEQAARDSLTSVYNFSFGRKLINDYLGHNSGDTLLQNFATLLRTVCRSTDCIGRMGGDEFSILLPSCPNWKAKELVLDIERAMQEFNRQVDVIPLFASLGVASAETMDVPMTRLIISADRSMLKRKHQQREKSHEAIRAYIERSKQILVSLEDCRY